MTKLEIQQGVSQEDLEIFSSIHLKTKNEGWAIFEANGSENGDEYRIEHFNDEGIFKEDSEAIRFVVLKALEGSKPHIDTIYFMGKYGSPSEHKFFLSAICDKKLEVSK